MEETVIEKIKHRLPVTEVIGSYISLVPSGAQFKARCPFHNERTASFTVSPDRGSYYCFGCGAKGDIFNFVQEFEGLDFKGALKILADRAGIVLSEYKAAAPKQKSDVVYDMLESATERYQSELGRNTEAQNYLAKRGVTPETITAFRLGYAPDEWGYISGGVNKAIGDVLERAGLSKAAEKGYYDRFRRRIMFPLMDASARVVGFSGRMFPDSDDGPKYLNSPETEVFNKTKILFGFDKAKQAIRQHNFAILVEGQMDLVLSHQAGFKNTVATSGTAVSEQITEDPSAQLSIISRLTPNIFLAFDGDKAGERALSRAALVALSLGMNPKVVELPEGVDPADFILEKGADGWKKLLKEAKHYILYSLQKVVQTTSAHNARVLIQQKVFPFILRVPSEIEQIKYLQMVGHELGIGERAVVQDFEKYKNTTAKNVSATPSAFTSSTQVKPFVEIKSMKLNPVERFYAFIKAFPEESKKAKEVFAKTDTLGESIVLPEIEIDEPTILSLEAEYSMLAIDAKEAVARELAEYALIQVLSEKHAALALQMSQAKARGDEAEEMRILSVSFSIKQLIDTLQSKK